MLKTPNLNRSTPANLGAEAKLSSEFQSNSDWIKYSSFASAVSGKCEGSKRFRMKDSKRTALTMLMLFVPFPISILAPLSMSVPQLTPILLTTCSKWRIEPELFLSTQKSLTNHPMLDSCTESDLDAINSTWKYKNSYSEYNLRWLLKHFPTACVRRKEDKAPIAWILTKVDGSIGSLYTLEEY